MVKKIFSYLIYNFPRILDLLNFFHRQIQFVPLRFYKDKETVAFIKSLYKTPGLLMQPNEAYMIATLVQMQRGVEGDMAEVGVFRGGSAKIICHFKENKTFYCFESFHGLPTPDEIDKCFGFTYFRERNYQSDYQTVEKVFEPYENVHLISGLFPESGQSLNGHKFSFVHLDIDLYRGTLESLHYFWDKMAPNGIILIHDTHSSGVKLAIQEFMAGHRTRKFECPGSQMIIMK